MTDLCRKSVLAKLVMAALLMPAMVLAQIGSLSDAERIKAAASTYHASGTTKVSVELKSGRSYKGRITSVEDDHFILLDPDFNRQVPIRYDDVAKLRKKGLSKVAKTAIWVGVGAGIGALIVFGPRSGPTICPLGCLR